MGRRLPVNILAAGLQLPSSVHPPVQDSRKDEEDGSHHERETHSVRMLSEGESPENENSAEDRARDETNQPGAKNPQLTRSARPWTGGKHLLNVAAPLDVPWESLAAS